MLKPQISVTLFPKKDRKVDTNTVLVEEPTTDYVAIAEEAASRLGKKLIIGAVVVVATYVVLQTAGAITVNALNSND